MKKQILLVVCFIFLMAGAAYAETFWTGSVYNDVCAANPSAPDCAGSSSGFVANVQNFDWSSSGSGNAAGMGPIATVVPGATFTFRYQASLFALNAPDGSVVPFPGLNSAFEYTVVAQIPEMILTVAPLGNGLNQAVFLTLAGGTFYMYHDATPNSNVLSGFGFDDGTLVASGTIDPNQFTTFTQTSATTGIGSTILRGPVTYVNPAYIDPAITIATLRFEGTVNQPPLDSTTQSYFDGRAGEGNLLTYPVAANDQNFKVDGSNKFGLKDSITCTKSCTATSPISISATVTNSGASTLTNVSCTDAPPMTLTATPAMPATLDPGASMLLSGSYTPTVCPSTDTLTCSGTGSDGTVVTTTCSATCCPGVGQCRMTGGSETLIEDPTYGPTYIWIPTTYASDNNGSVLITTGGQIGAPFASPTGPSMGEWEHQQHCDKKSGCTGAGFGFDFKAGTASGKAKDTTVINTVLCGDAGWCTQARCAPFKQIFWDGIGLVKNLNGASNPFTTCGGENSLHYFKAHVGDFGEPGGGTVAVKKCTTKCPWTSGGVDIANIVNLSPVSTAPEPFGSKGGQICPCGCGDWYEINIYCRSNKDANGNPQDPGAIIYKFASFIDTGNFQLHPPVGQHCE